MSRKTTEADTTCKGRTVPLRTSPPDPGRHSRKCCICRHPQRRDIETAFLEWHSPDVIAYEYRLPDRKSVYRHAHATGLWALRKRHLGFALERILEHAGHIEVVTAGDVISAVRAYTCINDDGEWVEPPRSRVVTHHWSLPSSNRDTKKVENDPTR